MVKPVKPLASKPLPALALGVIFRDNIETIKPFLDSIRGHFDYYAFVDTGSVDGTRQHIDKFLKSHNGAVQDFEWVDDFAKARNVSRQMTLGKSRWFMFLDTDDVLENGDRLRNILANIRGDVRMMFVPYRYDVDENLNTMRLCPNTPDWMFEDAIHERLVCNGDAGAEGENAGIIREVTVFHRRKSPAEKEAALRRNARIAEREYATTTDPAYKARLARTIAMIPKIERRFDDALPYLIEVGTHYPQLPEGRQAWSEVARFVAHKGDLEGALQYAKKAGPSYEALILSGMHRYDEVIERQTVGHYLPEQTTHEGFLFEKCIAPAALADAAWQVKRPAREVERAINNIRGDLRSHEAVAATLNKIRADINRITIVVPGTPQPFDGNSGKAMLGGSEEAVVHLTRELAAQGRNVRVFGVLPPLTVPGSIIDGVEWRAVTEFNPHDEHGTLVVWRDTGLVLRLADHQQAMRERRENGDESAVLFSGIHRSSLWLHDQSLGAHPDAAKVIPQMVNSVIVLSEHHKRKIVAETGADHKNIKVLANGIVAADFDGLAAGPRDKNRVVYSSCPTRGLATLLAMWPEVQAANPDAYLDIYYDWSMVAQHQPKFHKAIVDRLAEVQALGCRVVHHGGVAPAKVVEALAGCNVWAYSHFENVGVETSCISLMKAAAAGATPLTVRNGALPETCPEAIFVDHGDINGYKSKLVELLANPEPVEVRVARAQAQLERSSWKKVAEKFSTEWNLLQPKG